MFNRRRKKKDDKGFPCPSCMQSFASAEEVQLHYDDQHSDQNGHGTEDQGEGFLCPVCKISLASPEVLQSHYIAEHSQEDSISDSAQIRNGEITGVEIQELRRKMELMQSQLRGSEERRSLLSSEVLNHQQKVAQLSVQLQIVTAEKEGLETKAAQLDGENASLKVKVDEFEHQQKETDQHLATLTKQLDEKVLYTRNLDTQLAASQQTLDILVLRQELKTAQALNDKVTQGNEKKKEDLEKELSSFKVQLKVLQSSLSDRESALQEMQTSVASLEIDLMQEKYKREKLQEQVAHLTQILTEKETQLNQLQGEVNQYVEEKTTLQNIVQTTQTNLQQVEAQLVSKQNRLDQVYKSLEEGALNISCLQAALDEKGETVRLTQERELKATDAVADLTVQLHMMKTSLSDRTKEVEDLRREMANSESSSQSVLHERDQQISDLTVTVNKFQSDLEVKSSEMTDLQNQLSDSRRLLENERLQCGDLTAQMMEQDARMQDMDTKMMEQDARMQDMDTKMMEQDARMQDMDTKSTHLEDKIRDLENKLVVLSEEKQRLENERHDLVAKIDTGEGASELIHQIQQENSCLHAKLSSVESSQQLQVSEHFNQQQVFVKQIREVRGQLQESEAKVFKLESDLEDKSSKLARVQQKLLQAQSQYTIQTEQLLAAETSKTSQIAHLEKQMKEVNMCLQTTSSDWTSTQSQLHQAKRDVAAGQEEIAQLQVEISEQKDKLSAANQKIDSLDLQLKEKISLLAQAELEKKDMQLTLEANKQFLMESRSKLIEAEVSLQTERKSKVTEIGELARKLEVLSDERTSLQDKYEQVNCSLADVERQHSEKCSELESALENLTSTQAEFKKIEAMFLMTKESSDDQLMYLTTEFEKEKSKANEIKEELMKQVNSLTGERNRLSEEKMAFGEQVMNLSETLQQHISESDSMKQQLQAEKLVLQADVDSLQTQLHEIRRQADQYKKELSQVKQLLAMEQEEKLQTLEILKSSKDVLLQQKLDMETEFIQLQGEAEHWSEQLAKVKHEAQEVQAALRQENSTLLDKLAVLTLELDTLQKDKDEIEAEFDTQSTLLSENLTTVRTDLTIAEGNLDQLTTINEQLRGERIELEVKLERCNDERRVLVERCIASERECEKLQENVAEQRYRLEDIQGALHELGRENQTLQITTTTVQGRKWTDDSDVTECTSCGKVFSVVVRKHHCRHCGHIFCNECSSKITQTPMKKKASRVCDPCYRELSLQKL